MIDQRYTARGVAIVLTTLSTLMAVPLVAGCRDSPDHLDPVRSVLSEHEFMIPYLTQIREVLLASEGGKPYFRMVAMPSFSTEWVVTVDRPNIDAATVRVVEADRMIWNGGKPRKVRATTFVTTISASAAEAIRSLAERMLLDTKPCSEPDGRAGLDGETYELSSFTITRGLLLGGTWSPAENTRTGGLIELGNRLYKLAIANDEQRPAALRALDDSVEKLQRLMQAVSGGS